MPKKDNKKDKKVGKKGKEEPEKPKEEVKAGKDERKKGGKEDKKGKSHGRRGGEDEEYEEEDDDEEEEDEDEDERKRKKKSKDGHRHKDKGGKGEEKNKKKEKRKKEMSPEPPVKELPKKGLKNLSKMFMRFSGVRRRRNSRKKMGGTSRLFMGLGKRLRKNRENKVKKKTRRESILKNTSKFMIRFNHSKKNKKLKEKEAKEKEEKAGGKKPSYMLIRLGRGTEGQEKKVGFFNGLFRKKTGSPDFKAQSHLLGQVAGATNWLTKRFISTKHRQSAAGGSGWAGGGQRSGFGRQGGGGHSRQVSMRGQQAQQDRNHGYQNGDYQHDDDGDDVYEYTEEYDQQDMGGYDPRGVAGAGGFQRRSVKDHGGYGHTGYDDQEDPYGQQQVAGGQGGQGYYYDDTGEFYDVPSQDPDYYEDEPGLYDDEGGYYDDQQGLYDNEGCEYYDPYQQQQQHSYYDDQVAMGGYYGQQPMGMYGEEGGAMEYYGPMGAGQEYDEYANLYEEQMMMDPQQGHYDNGMQGQRGFYDDGMGAYEEMMMMRGRGGGGLYQDYQLHYSEEGLPFPDFSYNAYNSQQPGTQMPYGYDPMGGEIPQQGAEMAFRVPRPQVRLFGKERLDVPPAPFPPPPPPGRRDDILSEIQYEEQDVSMMSPQQQLLARQQKMMSQQQQMMEQQQLLMSQLTTPQEQTMSPHGMLMSQQRPMMSPQQQMDDMMMQQQQQTMSPHDMMMSQQRPMMSPQQQMDDMMMQQQQQTMSPHGMLMSQQQPMMSPQQQMDDMMMQQQQQMMSPHDMMMSQQRPMMSPQQQMDDMMMQQQQQMMSPHDMMMSQQRPMMSPQQQMDDIMMQQQLHMMSQQQQMMSERKPQAPTPTAMLIKQHNAPNGMGGAMMGGPMGYPGTPVMPRSPRMSPHPRRAHPSPTPSSRSMMMSPQQQMMSQHPSPGGSPLPTRSLSPSPQPSMRGLPPPGQRPPSVLYRRMSPPSSPHPLSPHRRLQPQRPPSLSLSPRRLPSPPISPRASMIRRSPPSSPRGSIRRVMPPPSSPSPSRLGGGSPFGARKVLRGTPSPSSPRRASPPASPQFLSRTPPHLPHPLPPLHASPATGGNPSGAPTVRRSRPCSHGNRQTFSRGKTRTADGPDPEHPYSDPYTQDPYGHSEQFVPSSPMLQGALQNQTLRNASFTSPHLRPMSPYAQQVPQYTQPSSPMLQGALQNKQLRNASFTTPLQQPMSPYAQDIGGYEDPMTPSSPMLQGALQNQQLRSASYASPLQRPMSSYGSMGGYDEPLPPSSPMLGNAIQNQALRGASFGSPALQRRGNPYGPVVTQYDYHAEPGPSPLLHNALQNPNMRNASFGTPMLQRRGDNPFVPVVPDYYGALQNPQMRQMVQSRDGLHPLLSPYGPLQPDPRFGNALQNHRGTNVTDPPNLAAALMNPALKTASYTLPDGTIAIGPQQQKNPNLSAALSNPYLKSVSYTLPDGTIIIDPRKPVSPSLGRALQNPALMNTSYTLPDGTIRDPNAPISPNLSSALNNPHLKSASYTLPDGSIIIDPRKPRSPNLLAALSNPYLKTISYELPDGSIIIDPRKPTSPNLSSALLNPAMRNASYALEGTVITDPNAPISPNLSSALMNPHLKSASYTLPDGSIIIDPRKPRSPNLLAALQNPYLKSVSYELPDGSVIIDPRKPRGPDLSGALSRNQDLSNQKRYRLGDGTLVIPGQKPRLGVALMNQNMRKVDYRLGDSGALSARPTNPRLSEALQENRDLLSPNRYRLPERNVLMRKFGNPYLDEALQNTQHLRYASYRLPPGLQGQDNRYAVVPPYGPRSGHWAGNARSGQEGDDVWASERVLPHGTVQNLTKWSMYREVMDSEGITPAAPGKPEGTGEPDWNPDREGEPNSWYEKIYSIRCIPTVGHRVKPWAYGMEDMTQMEELNETTVLMNLKKRYDQELIYTYIGSILVSVNPYRMFNMYGTDVVLQYEGQGIADNPPHLFSIASVSYTTMMDSKHNQCIIISGESGSGKTEATKMVLRYLTAIHHKRNITQQILEATPLLESFGNAKTVRNDNSSRFGKYVEIFLEEGVISGAITSQYLLEKSRIVFQGKSERNYHIFYEMLSGLEPQQKRSLYLQEAETYFYLNQGGDCVIEGKDDGSDFRRVQSAMDILCFSPDEQNAIYRLLSSVLHLGNVYFQPYQAEGQEVATVVSDQEIRVVAELLQISPEGLKKAITHKVTDIVREKIYTPLTVESAVDARDAVAKILYSLLFHWLTEKINGRVYPRNEALSISILDIYGFEDLLFNSFEQLCINYANETLQFYFNRIIFREEQEEYIREQISWQELPFSDNQAVINLIAAKPHGILRILDDQCGFPQATDHTFLQKCNYHHGNSDLYARPKMPLPEFTVKHYAGKVTYQVHKFLHKNFDLVRQDVLELFSGSKNRMVSNLFLKHSEGLASQQRSAARRGSTARRLTGNTVSAKFQSSLQDLVEKMERCNPYFVRCIKPNQQKEPGQFDLELVKTQLRYSGILETIRIRKEGYPIRIPFYQFLNRYKALLCLKEVPPADGETCVEMIYKLCPVKPGTYQVGVTKMFLKEQLYQLLEWKRDLVFHVAAVTMQRYTRLYFIRKKRNKFRNTMIQLQTCCRGHLARKRFALKRKYLIKFRSIVLLYINRRSYMKAEIEPIRRAEEEFRRIEEERANREVVNVTTLPIPAELGFLLQATAGGKELHSECLALVQAPKVQVDPQLTLPLDINNYLITHYIRTIFREALFGMLFAPLDRSLTRMDEELNPPAVDVFMMILRFMGDPDLNGAQENLFGNYIIQKGLANQGLRDEILAQVANQVWRNVNHQNSERGWLLLSACLSSFPPSQRLEKYLLKFVSDYGSGGYDCLCQHRLLQAMQRSSLGYHGARTYPPCLLEWTANRKRAHTVLQIHCYNGVSFLCPLHSWTTGEVLARDVLQH
ncbi:uncharacterized protein ACWYII_034144, partial [Salvelinus alpinus]